MDDTIDDAEAVRLARAGDDTGMAVLHRRYAAGLRAFVARLVGDRTAAEDVVQEVFVLAHLRLGQLADPARVKSWLYAVAARQGCSYLRVRRDMPADTVPEAPDPGHGPEDAALAGERLSILLAAADGLAPADQQVVRLYLRGLDGAALAAACGNRPEQASLALHRAKKRLHASLGAVLLARHAREDCAGLDGLLREWDGALSPLLRKRIVRHVADCPDCETQRRRLVRPEALLGVLTIAALPAALREEVARELVRTSAAATPAGGSAGGSAVAQGGGAVARLAAAAVAAAVTAAVVTAVAWPQDPEPATAARGTTPPAGTVPAGTVPPGTAPPAPAASGTAAPGGGSGARAASPRPARPTRTTTGPAAARPTATGPAATRPRTTRPTATRPAGTGRPASGPAGTGPAAADPGAPVTGVPAVGAPVPAAPDPAAPVPAAPVPAAPDPAAPVPAAPVPAAPDPAAPVPAAPVPAAPDPAAPVPAAPVPAAPDPSGPIAAVPDPAAPVPGAPEPVAPVPAVPDPAAPVPAAPVPAAPVPAAPGPVAPVPDDPPADPPPAPPAAPGAPGLLPCAPPTGPGVAAVSGALAHTARPASVLPGALPDPAAVHLFAERAGVAPSRPLPVNLAGPGVQHGHARVHSATAPAGACLRSHYLHLDGTGGPPGQVRFATVTFTTPVLGVITTPELLDNSDHLGSPVTAYPDGGPQRPGLDPADVLLLSPDRLTLHLRLRTGPGVDAVRVLTVLPGGTG